MTDRERETSSPFATRPMLVFWETTRACLLACSHCRATAQRHPLPGELDTQEGLQLLEQICAFGKPAPVVVFTGGDLLCRPDIYELLGRAQQLGLHIAAAPAVTPLLNRSALVRMQAAGVEAISLSLDALAGIHDSIRGVPGTFDRTIEAARLAQELGLRVQINTVVMAQTVHTLADVAAVLLQAQIPIWEVFFLIATGRAGRDDMLSAQDSEDVCRFLLDASCYDLVVRTVEAPFVRRILVERQPGTQGGPLHRQLGRRLEQLSGPPVHDVRIASKGTLDGDGIVFVAYDGTVSPGGFLPIPLGNVRQDQLSDIYRQHPLLDAIRHRQLLDPCGSCAHRFSCGGSRARAYSMTGNALAADPICTLAAAI
ncbi:MAG: TIGR04053 family radical SAM/SPASM domain-containing protein [Sulfobacillus sp.]